jgi:hypothetical protein
MTKGFFTATQIIRDGLTTMRHDLLDLRTVYRSHGDEISAIAVGAAQAKIAAALQDLQSIDATPIQPKKKPIRSIEIEFLLLRSCDRRDIAVSLGLTSPNDSSFINELKISKIWVKRAKSEAKLDALEEAIKILDEVSPNTPARPPRSVPHGDKP